MLRSPERHCDVERHDCTLKDMTRSTKTRIYHEARCSSLVIPPRLNRDIYIMARYIVRHKKLSIMRPI